ncbi:MAG: response regulator [Elusimicrobiota bacterium]
MNETRTEKKLRILIVEDDSAVRKTFLRVIRNRGYKLLEAGGGAEALRILGDHKEIIHLPLTDLVMPGIHGAEPARRVKSARPGIKVIFTSGYPAEAISHRGNLISGRNFLPKPFSPGVLAALVRNVLDSPHTPPQEARTHEGGRGKAERRRRI